MRSALKWIARFIGETLLSFLAIASGLLGALLVLSGYYVAGIAALLVALVFYTLENGPDSDDGKWKRATLGKEMLRNGIGIAVTVAIMVVLFRFLAG